MSKKNIQKPKSQESLGAEQDRSPKTFLRLLFFLFTSHTEFWFVEKKWDLPRKSKGFLENFDCAWEVHFFCCQKQTFRVGGPKKNHNKLNSQESLW